MNPWSTLKKCIALSFVCHVILLLWVSGKNTKQEINNPREEVQFTIYEVSTIPKPEDFKNEKINTKNHSVNIYQLPKIPRKLPELTKFSEIQEIPEITVERTVQIENHYKTEIFAQLVEETNLEENPSDNEEPQEYVETAQNKIYSEYGITINEGPLLICIDLSNSLRKHRKELFDLLMDTITELDKEIEINIMGFAGEARDIFKGERWRDSGRLDKEKTLKEMQRAIKQIDTGSQAMSIFNHSSQLRPNPRNTIIITDGEISDMNYWKNAIQRGANLGNIQVSLIGDSVNTEFKKISESKN